MHVHAHTPHTHNTHHTTNTYAPHTAPPHTHHTHTTHTHTHVRACTSYYYGHSWMARTVVGSILWQCIPPNWREEYHRASTSYPSSLWNTSSSHLSPEWESTLLFKWVKTIHLWCCLKLYTIFSGIEWIGCKCIGILKWPEYIWNRVVCPTIW